MTPLLLGLALALAAPQAKDPPKKDPPSIVGRWEYVSAARDGVPRDGVPLPLTFTADGKVEVRYEPAGVRALGTYTLNRSKDPAEIDLVWPEIDRPERCIYKFDGDRLVVCGSRDPAVRPTTFEPKAGAGYTVVVYQRAKDKE